MQFHTPESLHALFGDLGGSPRRGGPSWLRRQIARLAEARRIRRDMRHLHALSDEHLHDVGLTRDDLYGRRRF